VCAERLPFGHGNISPAGAVRFYLGVEPEPKSSSLKFSRISSVRALRADRAIRIGNVPPQSCARYATGSRLLSGCGRVARMRGAQSGNLTHIQGGGQGERVARREPPSHSSIASVLICGPVVNRLIPRRDKPRPPFIACATPPSSPLIPPLPPPSESPLPSARG